MTQWTFLGVPVVSGAGTDVVTLTVYDPEQASLAGRYLNDVGAVQSARLSAEEFAARWYGRPVGGVAVEWRAGRVVEALRQAGPPPGAERYRKMIRRVQR
jgi:hypothetical protein